MGKKTYRSIWIFCLAALFLTGCISRPQKTEKLQDLSFTVLDKEAVPEELKSMIEENKSQPFKLTYADQGQLYIAQGYGAQMKTGYSVEVLALYETKNAVYIHTNLLGPEKGEKTKEITTFPYVVVQLKYIETEVIFD